MCRESDSVSPKVFEWWVKENLLPRDQWVKADFTASISSAGSGLRSRFKLIGMSRVGLQG